MSQLANESSNCWKHSRIALEKNKREITVRTSFPISSDNTSAQFFSLFLSLSLYHSVSLSHCQLFKILNIDNGDIIREVFIVLLMNFIY